MAETDIKSSPKGWEVTQIREITIPFETCKPNLDPERKFQYIDIGSIDNSTNTVNQPKVFLGKDAPSRARRVVKRNDVLFSTVRTYLKNITRVPSELDGVLTSTGIAVLRTPYKVCNDFLFYFVLSDLFIRKISGDMDGTLYPAVKDSDVSNSEILLPPLNEQRRIVAKIEALTERSRKAREAIADIPALLDQFRQSVLAAAFRGDLTADWRKQNPDVEPASVLLERIRTERRDRWEKAELEKFNAKGKVPKNQKWKDKYPFTENLKQKHFSPLPQGWCWVQWSQIGLCQNGRAFPSKEYSSSGFKLLRPGNLHASGEIIWNDSNTKYMPNHWAEEFPTHIIGSNELVINLTAQSLADEFLGRVCLTGEGESCLLNQRIARLTPAVISPNFCLWLFKSAYFRKYVDSLNTGSLIQHMFVSQIDEFVFPLPPLEEQEQIVSLINSQISQITNIIRLSEEAFEKLPLIDQSILAQAFRGDLVPQDPNDEPASVLLDRIRAEREKLKPAKKKKKTTRKKPPKSAPKQTELKLR